MNPEQELFFFPECLHIFVWMLLPFRWVGADCQPAQIISQLVICKGEICAGRRPYMLRKISLVTVTFIFTLNIGWQYLLCLQLENMKFVGFSRFFLTEENSSSLRDCTVQRFSDGRGASRKITRVPYCNYEARFIITIVQWQMKDP